jgi:predicted RNA-binding Zn ribbon-like protein
MWEWLGEPSLAMDFANTVKRQGAEDVDWLRTGDDLADWARLTPEDVPVVSPGVERLDEVRAFRDDVIAVLRAVLDGATPPSGALARLNGAARRVPVAPQWQDGRAVLAPVGSFDPLDLLLARVAASAIEIAAGSGPAMAFCDAPSCGTFFVPNRANQQWCGEPCGVRARVARHAARHR